MPAPRSDSLFARFTRWAQDVTDEFSEEDDDTSARPRGRLRDDATVRRTRQITSKDCGIAALSMMVDVPYGKARAALFAKGERCVGTDYRRMRRALLTFGILGSQRFRRFRSWDAIETHAVVHIQWRSLPKKDPGHWVVLQKLDDGYRVLDPASLADTLTASDVSPMRGVAYLPVSIVERRGAARRGRPR